jgi:hypothetical protein
MRTAASPASSAPPSAASPATAPPFPPSPTVHQAQARDLPHHGQAPQARAPQRRLLALHGPAPGRGLGDGLAAHVPSPAPPTPWTSRRTARSPTCRAGPQPARGPGAGPETGGRPLPGHRPAGGPPPEGHRQRRPEDPREARPRARRPIPPPAARAATPPGSIRATTGGANTSGPAPLSPLKMTATCRTARPLRARGRVGGRQQEKLRAWRSAPGDNGLECHVTGAPSVVTR